MVKKSQMIRAVVKFIEKDLIPNVGDRNIKFVLAVAKDGLKESPEIADVFLKSPMVSALITEHGDEYDISRLSSIMKNILSEYQSFTVAIPKIPLFSPAEKAIRITAEDFDSLLEYINADCEQA